MKILAGDIGGTKTWLRIADCDGDQFNIIFEKRFFSRKYADFTDLLRDFLADVEGGSTGHKLEAACLAIAGPVEAHGAGQQAIVTNLPWSLDSDSLAETIGCQKVELVNDFTAIALSIDALPEAQLMPIQVGVVRPLGPRIILGAGTGLGVCQICRGNDNHALILPSEGGHVDFAPTDKEQLHLLEFMLETHEHVSYEHILSGPGLANIYSFLRSTVPHGSNSTEPDPLTSEDPAAAISNRGRQGTDPLARRAVDIFTRVYGAQAGNLALLNMAFGGVYIAGGIATHMSQELISEMFLKAFHNKGRMTALMRKFPVYIIMNAQAGLIGAMLRAAQ